MQSFTLRWLIPFTLVVLLLASCGDTADGGGNGGGSGFTIDDPEFSASLICYVSTEVDGSRADGATFEIRPEGYSPVGNVVGSFREFESVEEQQEVVERQVRPQGGIGQLWCLGAVHRYVGTQVFQDFEFRSETADPLEFEVLEEGYAYKSGAGSVIAPDGTATVLP